MNLVAALADRTGNTFMTASSEPDAFDPTCPKYPGFLITTCDLPAYVNVNSIPSGTH